MERLRSLIHKQGGQTTAEYALVLVVAGIVVGVLIAVVKSGALAELFHNIISGLVEQAGG